MPKFNAVEAIKEFPLRFSRDVMFQSTSSRESGTFSKSELSIDSCELKILIQNMWCIPVLTPNIQSRISGICNIIKTGEFDIIAFTEVWSLMEREQIISIANDNSYIYFHYFQVGMGLPFWPNITGTGLLVLSKYPIIETIYKRFSLNGDPLMLHHSDYYGAKGIGLVSVWTKGGPINVYISHPQASYRADRTDYYETRVTQIFEIAQFIRMTAKHSLIVLAGDLNATPEEFTTQLLKEMLPNIQDSWITAHPSKSLLI